MTTQLLKIAGKEIRTEASRWSDRLMDGDVTSAERYLLQQWLKVNESHQREFRAHNAVVNLARDLPEAARAEILALATQDIQEEKSKRSVWLSALAASLLVGLGLVGWFTYQSRTAP